MARANRPTIQASTETEETEKEVKDPVKDSVDDMMIKL